MRCVSVVNLLTLTDLYLPRIANLFLHTLLENTDMAVGMLLLCALKLEI